MATDDTFDELISTWLQETAPAEIPGRVLEEAAQRTRTSRQQVRWRGLLRGMDLSRAILVLGGTAAIVVAAVVALSPRVGQPEVGQLPTTPDAWTRVTIDAPSPGWGVDTLFAGPRGLLAFLGEGGSHAMQLSVSTDGRTWTLVPNEQFPSDTVLLPPPGSLRQAAVVTDDAFFFVADGNDVWASEAGSTWQRLTDRARDEDLRAGQILAVVIGGPGLIAVGSDNTAWYSEDGSEWALAEVPAPPTASFEEQGFPAPIVEMQGVAGNAGTYVAWGTATSVNEFDERVQETVLWTSADGRSWAYVPDQADLAPLRSVAAGPGGFVATDVNSGDGPRAIRLSANGRSWETVASFESSRPSADAGLVASVAGSSGGYVVAGGDGVCAIGPCPAAAAAIWTSPDGRSWSRLPGDDLLEVPNQGSGTHSGAVASSAVTWDTHFVVAGVYDGSPVVWISGTPRAAQTGVTTAAPSSEPGNPFLGVWTSTSDADGGTQTMTVEPAGEAVEVVVTDTVATVCSGTPSTMTGRGSVDGFVLVIPAPDYRCNDGTEATPESGPPLDEQLQNLTYTYDGATDTLTVGIGDVWVREGAEVPSEAPPSEPVTPAVSAGASSFEPIVRELVCGNLTGVWSYPATEDQLAADVLGCSLDGIRVLIQKGEENLFVVHADGSETQVTEQLSGFARIPGSARPTGATLSSDGSRVVFAGLLTSDAPSCHAGALFAVSTDGGPAEVLWESQAADGGGIVRNPTFSPDGTRIAFADGYCDSNHSVWVMNADGSDAHQIVSSDVGPLGATHVHGLAWSADGEELALEVDEGRYTFAADGSGATQSTASEFCWPNEPC